MGKLHITLLTVLSVLLLSSLFAAQPAVVAAKGPDHLEFYYYIAVQNNSNLNNPTASYTAVQSAQPPSPQNFSFGIIHTFDNPITSAPDLNSTHLGRAQGWYGDVGQQELTLFLVETFTWNDTKYSGTFSLLGVDVANDAVKLAPIVGGTGDFANVRGVAQITAVSISNVNMENVSWFKYKVDFVY